MLFSIRHVSKCSLLNQIQKRSRMTTTAAVMVTMVHHQEQFVKCVLPFHYSFLLVFLNQLFKVLIVHSIEWGTALASSKNRLSVSTVKIKR